MALFPPCAIPVAWFNERGAASHQSQLTSHSRFDFGRWMETDNLKQQQPTCDGQRERVCISPPVLRICDSPMRVNSGNEAGDTASQSFSKIAQKMVDEQVSICQSFKSRIEQSLQELHKHWDRKGATIAIPAPAPPPPLSDAVRTRRLEETTTTGTGQLTTTERATVVKPRSFSPPLGGCDRRGDGGECCDVAARRRSPGGRAYPSPLGLDVTKTAIHKPNDSSSYSSGGWDTGLTSPLHCKSPPYRVPARKVPATMHSPSTLPVSSAVAQGDQTTSPALTHAVKLEEIHDGQKSAFTSYANARVSPTSSSFYRCDRRSPQNNSFVVERERRLVASDEDAMMAVVDQGVDVQCARVDSSDTVSRLLRLTQVANEHLSLAVGDVKPQKRRTKGKGNDCLHLWEFLRDLLNKTDEPAHCIEWTCRERGEFRLIKTAVVAKLWGKSKNRHQMTYEKMARAMRYYYKMNILEKVPNKRLHFRFGVHMLPKVICE